MTETPDPRQAPGMRLTPEDRARLGFDATPEVVELEQPKDLRQWGLSWVRTAVPVAWGFVLTFAATRFPAIHALLDNPHVYAVVEGAITVAWYGLFRAVEGHLPAWLTRFVLGANTAPVYPARGIVVDGDGYEVR
jgi:hypothetical protein